MVALRVGARGVPLRAERGQQSGIQYLESKNIVSRGNNVFTGPVGFDNRKLLFVRGYQNGIAKGAEQFSYASGCVDWKMSAPMTPKFDIRDSNNPQTNVFHRMLHFNGSRRHCLANAL